jgi:hypothetical protein
MHKMEKVNVSRTFTFTEEAIKAILCQYLAETEGVTVTPDNLITTVDRGYEGSGYQGSKAASLKSISATTYRS